MSRTDLIVWASWAAIANGTLGILAILALVVFYGGIPMFGPVNDVLTLVAALPLLALVVILHRLVRRRNPRLSLVATSFGLVGAAGIVTAMALFIAGIIPLTGQGVLFILSFGPLGIWAIAANLLARSEQIITSRLAWFGVIVGLGELIACLSIVLFGGISVLYITDYQSLMTNYPLLIGAGLGGFVGYVGAPIWAVWLGRELGAAKAAREVGVKTSDHLTR